MASPGSTVAKDHKVGSRRPMPMSDGGIKRALSPGGLGAGGWVFSKCSASQSTRTEIVKKALSFLKM
jgi:hypothetical protein